MSKKAFLIGKNNEGLKYSENDVSLLANALEKYAFEIIKVVGSRIEILEAFSVFINECDETDSIIVYFSGHGIIEQDNLWLLVDSDPSKYYLTSIKASELIDGLKYCDAINKLLILDSCNANKAVENLKLSVQTNFNILTASENLEYGKELEKLNGSFLTYYLSEALNTPITNQFYNTDNKIVISKIYDWLKKKAKNYDVEVPIPNLISNAKSDFEFEVCSQFLLNDNIQIREIESFKYQIEYYKQYKNSDLSINQLTDLVRYFKEKSTNSKLDNDEIESLYLLKNFMIEHIVGDFNEKLKKSEIHSDILFEKILFDELSENLVADIQKIRKDNAYKYWERCILVSALTLSIINQYNSQKIDLLLDFLTDFENEVWQRALVGLVLGLYKKDKKIQAKSEIKLYNRLLNLQDIDIVQKGLLIIENELNTQDYLLAELDVSLPEVKKLHSQLNLPIPSANKQNRDLLDIIARFKTDVFFKKPQNWFLPFMKENQYMRDAVKNTTHNIEYDSFIDNLSFSLTVCNSDKYTLATCLDKLNEFQVNTMMKIFEFENTELNKLFNSNELEKKSAADSIYTSYLKDIYQFYKNYETDRFTKLLFEKINLYNTDILDMTLNANYKAKLGADKSYENGQYNEALEGYIKFFNNNNDNLVAGLIADCYKFLGQYEKAIEFYKVYYPINPDWTNYIISYSYIELKDNVNAKLYIDKLINSEENYDNLKNIVRLFEKLENYKNAIAFATKCFNLNKNDIEILFSIGWFHFILGDLNNAEHIFNQYTNDEGYELATFLNLGHIALCKRDIEKAKEFYKNSIKRDFDNFINAFDDDYKYVSKFGVPTEIYFSIKDECISYYNEN